MFSYHNVDTQSSEAIPEVATHCELIL